ncbi:hypothetical protein SAMN05421748_12189 [Paractinoplanes atraurantiacus]|uniref:Uncharacterized protein n=1 Tax=Paractinoplanes atraurantiacus TaxID=1036182 RepID=A0A285JJ16_9ACTN|nr:hypothetical protein SAMN05421748_12189 [Actinoplanes atraurantiacus]
MTYRGKTIADVLAMSVDDAAKFLADVPETSRAVSASTTLTPTLEPVRPKSGTWLAPLRSGEYR